MGTVQFGVAYGVANKDGKLSDREARAILAEARTSGIDTLDTAIAYGDSERRLGELGIRDWRVVSKLPPLPERCDDLAAWVDAAALGSLSRLKIKSLHGLLLHRPAQLLESQGEVLYRALQNLKARGLVSKVGVSVYAPDELEPLVQRFALDIIQVPFNVLDRRMIAGGWLTRLSREGVEVHVRSILLQGLLAMSPAARPEQFGCWSGLWKQWDNWLAETGLTPLEACVRYALGFPEIDRVLVGVDNVRQLREVLAAASGPMPEFPEGLQTSDIDLLNPARWNAQ